MVTVAGMAIVSLLVAPLSRPQGSGSLPPGPVIATETPSARGPAPAPTPSDSAPPTAGASPVACRPTDQDAYVYHPDRLEILAACIRVTGTIAAVRNEADGDLHILLDVDSQFRDLLRPSNEGVELGDLVVEPVCIERVTQADAEAICASDPDPLAGPYPSVGVRVWMEGRYVLDLQHGGWAELHPLYRWGLLDGSGGSGGSGPPTPPAATPGSAGGSPGAYYTPPGWDGVSDVDCADFDTHAHAQSFFIGTGGTTGHDLYRLDGDHDGRACEALP